MVSKRFDSSRKEQPGEVVRVPLEGDPISFSGALPQAWEEAKGMNAGFGTKPHREQKQVARPGETWPIVCGRGNSVC